MIGRWQLCMADIIGASKGFRQSTPLVEAYLIDIFCCVVHSLLSARFQVTVMVHCRRPAAGIACICTLTNSKPCFGYQHMPQASSRRGSPSCLLCIWIVTVIIHNMNLSAYELFQAFYFDCRFCCCDQIWYRPHGGQHVGKPLKGKSDEYCAEGRQTQGTVTSLLSLMTIHDVHASICVKLALRTLALLSLQMDDIDIPIRCIYM